MSNFATAREAARANQLLDYIDDITPDIPYPIPIDKGGTGATTTAIARNNLELGTLAVKNKITLPTDIDSGILPITNGGTGASIGETALTNLGSIDWVVEEGTSGIWTYRRWHSGIAECWGRVRCNNIKASVAWGSIYETATAYGNINYPFTFDTVPNQTMQISGTSAYVYWLNPPNGSTSGENNTETNTGKWNFSRPRAQSDANRTADVDIYVKGMVTT